METQRTRHPDRRTEHGIGHVGAVGVVEVITPDESQGLDGLQMAAAKGIHREVLHCSVVVVYVGEITGFQSHDTTHSEHHVEQREPRGIEALAV